MASITPRRAKFDGEVTVTWDDLSNFNGFLLVGVELPTNYSFYTVAGTIPTAKLPIFARIPITNGKFSTSSSLFYNADLTPPNTQYVCWYYDLYNLTPVAGPSTPFQVTSDPITPPVLTLTAPLVSNTPPLPDT